MKRVFAVTATLLLLCLGIAAQADVFNLGAGLTNLETVAVGDPGNAGELSGEGVAGGYGPDRISGSVSYSYEIGKYEVTAGQYCDFLNYKAALDPYGLYSTSMWDTARGCKIQRSGVSGSYSYTVASDWANRPVNYVSYWDACRFANWLGNGQGTGSTETGAYTLDTYNGSEGNAIQRNPGAKWFLTSDDEWYKAAYYKGGGQNAGYWDYPTRSDSTPSKEVLATDPGNNANYHLSIYEPYYRTIAGEFENSKSAYGTFDQAGNVWEWNEALEFPAGSPWPMNVYRSLRGGSFAAYDESLRASYHIYSFPTDENDDFGFRVATVPEPSSLLALGALVAPMLAFRRRRSVG